MEENWTCPECGSVWDCDPRLFTNPRLVAGPGCDECLRTPEEER